ncbi:MAG: NAD(+) diphosphatase [Corynebacterium sp.]|uniref:NAD(+) diphosphatase n=1 Tax=Corynebacterium sp. TaxID=1720 RepID=UPI0026DB1C7C|nr:NAD(+) diphosphatase [Corynebacterium sp.]MDO4761223.1 NAD(+) diphosphatase [Corynebacterium sp.]
MTLKTTKTVDCYIFDEHGHTLVDAHGTPLLQPANPRRELFHTTINNTLVGVQRTTRTHHITPHGYHWQRCFTPEATHALALLRHREITRFHPETGAPLNFSGVAGIDITTTQEIFPRIDPAIICLIELHGQQRILLGKNRLRPHFHSLIAGYVGLGESLEDAARREVLEETGRRITALEYGGSQPWPFSGSIMVGFSALTVDEHPVAETDEELVDLQWFSRRQIVSGAVQLPGSGTIARRMIDSWVQQGSIE